MAEAASRVVASGGLRPGGVSQAIFNYLVAHLTGELGHLPPRSQDIAQAALGLPSDFDVTSVNDVRVEVGRLRQHLAAYYAGAGRDDPLRLEIPRGKIGLVPVKMAQLATEKQGGERQNPWPRSVFLGLALVVVAVLLAVTGRIARQNPPDFPLVMVAPVTVATQQQPIGWMAAGIESQLVAELSHYRSLRVTSEGQGSAVPPETLDYRISAILTDRDSHPALSITLLHMPEAKAVWSRRSEFDPADPDLAGTFFAVTREMVGQIGGPFGAIQSESRDRLAAFVRNWESQPTSTFLCVLHWQSFDITKDPAEMARARNCLTQKVQEQTPNSTIWASYAFLTFLDWTRDGARPTDPRLETAEKAATRAVELDPFGSDGHESLGSILSALHRHDAARAALERAAELNPSNPEIRIKLGWEDCLSGDWDAGIELIHSVIGGQSVVPGWYRIPLALDAFRRGDYALSMAEAQRIAASGDRRGTVLLLAAALRADQPHDVERAKRALAQDNMPPVLAWSEMRAVFDDPALNVDYLATLQLLGPDATALAAPPKADQKVMPSP